MKNCNFSFLHFYGSYLLITLFPFPRHSFLLSSFIKHSVTGCPLYPRPCFGFWAQSSVEDRDLPWGTQHIHEVYLLPSFALTGTRYAAQMQLTDGFFFFYELSLDWWFWEVLSNPPVQWVPFYLFSVCQEAKGPSAREVKPFHPHDMPTLLQGGTVGWPWESGGPARVPWHVPCVRPSARAWGAEWLSDRGWEVEALLSHSRDMWEPERVPCLCLYHLPPLGCQVHRRCLLNATAPPLLSSCLFPCIFVPIFFFLFVFFHFSYLHPPCFIFISIMWSFKQTQKPREQYDESPWTHQWTTEYSIYGQFLFTYGPQGFLSLLANLK